MQRQTLMLSAAALLAFGAAAQAIPQVTDPGPVKAGLQSPIQLASAADGDLRVVALREP